VPQRIVAVETFQDGVALRRRGHGANHAILPGHRREWANIRQWVKLADMDAFETIAIKVISEHTHFGTPTIPEQRHGMV